MKLEQLFEEVLREAASYTKWAIFKINEKTKEYSYEQNTSGAIDEVYNLWISSQKFADISYIIAPVSDSNQFLITNQQEASQAAAQVTQYLLTLSKKIQRGRQITPKTYMNSWGSKLSDRQRLKNDFLIKDKPLTPTDG